VRIGDGDHAVDNAMAVNTAHAFTTQAELVIVNTDIVGSIDRVTAASAIGSATGAYALGDSRIFVVDNHTDSLVYLFTSADTNAQVGAAELTLLGALHGTAQTAITDYAFA
jgi:hypothetical protein